MMSRGRPPSRPPCDRRPGRVRAKEIIPLTPRSLRTLCRRAEALRRLARGSRAALIAAGGAAAAGALAAVVARTLGMDWPAVVAWSLPPAGAFAGFAWSLAFQSRSLADAALALEETYGLKTLFTTALALASEPSGEAASPFTRSILRDAETRAREVAPGAIAEWRLGRPAGFAVGSTALLVAATLFFPTLDLLGRGEARAAETEQRMVRREEARRLEELARRLEIETLPTPALADVPDIATDLERLADALRDPRLQREEAMLKVSDLKDRLQAERKDLQENQPQLSAQALKDLQTPEGRALALSLLNREFAQASDQAATLAEALRAGELEAEQQEALGGDLARIGDALEGNRDVAEGLAAAGESLEGGLPQAGAQHLDDLAETLDALAERAEAERALAEAARALDHARRSLADAQPGGGEGDGAAQGDAASGEGDPSGSESGDPSAAQGATPGGDGSNAGADPNRSGGPQGPEGGDPSQSTGPQGGSPSGGESGAESSASGSGDPSGSAGGAAGATPPSGSQGAAGETPGSSGSGQGRQSGGGWGELPPEGASQGEGRSASGSQGDQGGQSGQAGASGSGGQQSGSQSGAAGGPSGGASGATSGGSSQSGGGAQAQSGGAAGGASAAGRGGGQDWGVGSTNLEEGGGGGASGEAKAGESRQRDGDAAAWEERFMSLYRERSIEASTFDGRVQGRRGEGPELGWRSVEAEVDRRTPGVSAGDLFMETRAREKQALDQQDIPFEYKDSVRRYFDAIEVPNR
jgi:hypothetical protein